jgi:hypothetical protein
MKPLNAKKQLKTIEGSEADLTTQSENVLHLGPYHLSPRRPAYWGIRDLGEVATIDGPMRRVHLYQRGMEITRPDQDVAIMVGMVGPKQSELWIWADNFWMKALSGSTEWYRPHPENPGQKCYLFYPVFVNLPGGAWDRFEETK